ncbi:alpha/beta hydrolase [Kutzneria viridogrisea]|uniref:AB hydrolase-1 domain-containing protein n=2 Tax=Kutzneria TaxID=43356 RepID=W5WM89_9PSEU|nr:alpha/beta hydrolase [Kutzneria albida]AHI01988.1 hypothetical protein KALB_8631 [Kutzneria albida DSM 43870]MBA8929589.1 pimeloyl-ACP methyl ester carboxylesterase [Kutzneria viridogrisea]
MEHRQVQVNGTELHVVLAGDGPPVVLLHGWPHTWFLWREVIAGLAPAHRVIAPDLRGVGGSARAAGGYDLHTLSGDVIGLLDVLGEEQAAVVGIDAGAPVAWMSAMRHGARVSRLVVMEALIGELPGAEEFGRPWWFGFHGVPGLAETVLEGREQPYLDWFLRGIGDRARHEFVAAYTGREALRCGFEYYRAMPRNAEQVAAAARRRLTTPTLAIAGGAVGTALHGQLLPIADDLRCVVVPDCGHLIPEEQPEALLGHLLPFLSTDEEGCQT